MSVRTMALVWEHFPEGGSALLAMLALADFGNDQGGSIHPSVRTFAKKIRLSSRQAQKVLRALESDGWIATVSTSTGGVAKATRRYRTNIKKLSDTPVTGDTPVMSDTPVTGDADPCHGGREPLSPMTPEPLLTTIEPLKPSSSGDEVEILKEFYTTKRKRKLSDWKLKAFYRFWDAFAYKSGKAEAADAWLDIPSLTANLVDNEILPAATHEARRRPQLREKKCTPKMAQGWLSGRRWEDEIELPGSGAPGGVPDRTEDEWQDVARDHENKSSPPQADGVFR